MNRAARAVIWVVLTLGVVRLDAGETTLTFRAGYFWPSDAMFKQIYGPGPIFSLEMNAGVSKSFAVWAGGGRYSRGGTLTLSGEPTRLWLVPLAAGLKYIWPAGSFRLYAGAGGGYFKFVETNRIGTVSPGRLGVIATAGVFYQAPGGWLVDAGLKYSFCRMHPAEFEFGVGGLEAGLGIGYRIPPGALTRESGGEKKVEFALSAGVIKENRDYDDPSSAAALWLEGNVDLHLGKSLMVSPEIAIEPAGFVTLSPGATLNYEIGIGFVGAGLVVPITLTGEDSGLDAIAPKLQFGLRVKHLRLTAGFVFRNDATDLFLGLGYQGVAVEPGQLKTGAAGELPSGKNKTEFGLSAGVATNLGGGESFATAVYSLGGQIDFDLGGKILLSPELLVYTTLREDRSALLLPGALLNYRLGDFFIGAGVAAYIGSPGDSGFQLLPKFNAGYRGKRVTLTGYLVTTFEYLFQASVIGASVGYRF